MYAMNVNTGAAKAGWGEVGFNDNLITGPNVLLAHKSSEYATIEDFFCSRYW